MGRVAWMRRCINSIGSLSGHGPTSAAGERFLEEEDVDGTSEFFADGAEEADFGEAEAAVEGDGGGVDGGIADDSDHFADAECGTGVDEVEHEGAGDAAALVMRRDVNGIFGGAGVGGAGAEAAGVGVAGNFGAGYVGNFCDEVWQAELKDGGNAAGNFVAGGCFGFEGGGAVEDVRRVDGGDRGCVGGRGGADADVAGGHAFMIIQSQRVDGVGGI